MKTYIYRGGFPIVEKSGVGKAIEHQEKMLNAVEAPRAARWKEATVVHMNTVFPDSVIAAFIAKMQKKKVIYYGHSTMEDFKNSFGDYTGSLYTAWGMTDGDYMYIETDRYNVPQSVCFYSTPRDNGKITSYAPEFKTISVDMKIDGGETLSFAAKGNNGSERLCLLSPTRFLRNIQDASNLKIALPYINHYDIVDEVKEWNVSQIGVKFK